jgi:hypothetical protein
VKRRFLTLLTLMITLSACGNAATMSSTDKIVSGIYTAGALTLDAQVRMVAASSTPLPVSTATPTDAPMLIPPTAVPTLTPFTTTPVQNRTSGLWQNSKVSTNVDLSLCENSTYIDDITIPDGTVLAPGEVFVKKWTLKNTGYCMWRAGYILTFLEGDSMSGLSTEVGRAIRSGDMVNISVTLTAPTSEGTYTGYWIMADDFGYSFGMPIYVQIIVSNG